MSEMVECVARAIAAVWGHNAGSWRTMRTAKRELYFEAARAAIAAMREPTEAMIEASNREWDGRMSHRSSGAWRAMIDAALADDAPPTPSAIFHHRV